MICKSKDLEDISEEKTYSVVVGKRLQDSYNRSIWLQFRTLIVE
jgi:hypothetical protein